MIKANPSNLFQLSGDIYKLLVKTIQNEKVPDVRCEVVKCLKVFVSHTLTFTTMHQYFEQILQQSLKGFEDLNPQIRDQYVQICYSIFNQRLKESQQQGDIKTLFKQYNQTLREQIQGAQKKKQSANIIDVPRTLAGTVSFISAIIFRFQSNPNANPLSVENMRNSLLLVLRMLFKEQELHVEATDPEFILSSFLLLISNRSTPLMQLELEKFKQREGICQTLSTLCTFLDENQKIKLLKHCVQCLNTRQLIISKDSMDLFSSFCKNQKMSTMINDCQEVILLRLENELLFVLEPVLLRANFASEKDFLDPIIPYIRNCNNQIQSLYAIEVIKTLGLKAHFWINEMLSIFLSFTTISNADLTGLKYTLIYVNKEKQSTQSVNLKNGIQNLNFQAQALASLLYSFQASNKNIPLALTNQSFNAAKGMILGNWNVEDEDDDLYFSMDLQKLDVRESQRREAGWIILEGLLNLGNQWVGSKFAVLIKLFNVLDFHNQLQSVFSKEMSSVNFIQLGEPHYLEKILYEFKIKKAALGAMKQFLTKNYFPPNSSSMKYLSQYLSNTVGFFFTQDKDKKDLYKYVKHFFPQEVVILKSLLLECLAYIPSHLYSSKYVQLLHPVCEEIVSEDITFIPSIFRKLVHQEDQYKQEDYFDPDEAALFEKYIPVHILDRPVTRCSFQNQLSYKDSLVSNSIAIFGEVFASSLLNVKNKNQLIKHFIAHSQPNQLAQNLKQKVVLNEDSKTLKLSCICLALLNASKTMSKKGECFEIDFINETYKIFANSEQQKSQNLVKITSEAYLHFLIPHILKNTSNALNSLFTFLQKELPQSPDSHDEWVKKAKVLCILGNMVRSLDYDSIIGNVFPNIMDLIGKLSRESNNNVRQFFLHYTQVIAKRIGLANNQYFSQWFPTAFHQMQTDIKTDFFVLNSLGRSLEVQIRQDYAQIMENKRAQVGVSEFIHALFLNRPTQPNSQILITSLKIVKNLLIVDPDFCTSTFYMLIVRVSMENIIKFCIDTLSNKVKFDIDIRMKIVELIAALIYQGEFPKLKEKCPGGILHFFMNELNSSTFLIDSSLVEKRLQKKLSSTVAKMMTSFDDFENLLNFRQGFNFENEKLFAVYDKETMKPYIYLNALKTLIVYISKMLARENLPEFIEYTKFVSQYKHTSQFLQYEETKKEAGTKDPGGDDKAQIKLFGRHLLEDTQGFMVKVFKKYIELFTSAEAQSKKDSGPDIKKHLSTLIGLAFSITSNDSTLLKKKGLSLVIVLIKTFSKTIEKIGDDDDDPRNMEKIFLRNPLLLEQYEAQIFSIIRQNMVIGGKTVDPEIMIKNFRLINLFLTIPICKDQQIIKKILTALVEQIQQGTNVHNFGLQFFERMNTELQYQKLILISKVLIQCFSNEKFKRIETNQKKLLEKEQQQERSGKETLLDKLSKFQKEDKERILEALTQQQFMGILKNVLLALKDNLLILSIPRASHPFIKDFSFIKNGLRSAYNLDTVEKSVPIFMKLVSLTSEMSKFYKFKEADLIGETEKLILNSLLVYNLKKPIDNQSEKDEQKQGKKGSNQNSEHLSLLIYQNCQNRIFYFEIFLKALSSNLLIIEGETEDGKVLSVEMFKEYQAIFEQYLRLDVIEIYQILLKIFVYFLQNNFSNWNLPDSTKKLSTEMYFSETVSLAGELFNSIKDEKDCNSEQTLKVQTFYRFVLENLFDQLSVIQNFGPENFNQEILVGAFRFIFRTIGVHLQEIKNEQLQLYTFNYFFELLGKKSQCIQALDNGRINKKSEVIFEFIYGILPQLFEKEQSQQQLQFYMTLVSLALPLISDLHLSSLVIHEIFNSFIKIQAKQSLAKELNSEEEDEDEDDEQEDFIIKFIKLWNTYLLKSAKPGQPFIAGIIAEMMSLIYEVLADLGSQAEENEEHLLKTMFLFVMSLYQPLLTQQQRITICEMYMTLILTLIQNKKLSSQFRNSLLEWIFKICQSDQEVFKAYVQGTATPPEKQLIEKIIKEISQRSQTVPSTQTGNLKGKPAQKQEQKSNYERPAAKKGGLSMDFKMK